MNVVKRDGTVQRFSEGKLNRWSEWSSDECGVSWSDIVIGASRHFYDMILTSKIHDLLINECLNKRTFNHSKMAARLMIGSIYKEAYNGFNIPTLKDFYHEAVENGWWEDLGYSDDDLDVLGLAIDHSKDFTYTYSTLKQFYDKYLVDVGRKVESPQIAFMGIAMATMTGGVDEVIKTYQKLSDLQLNLPTPTLNGARTPMESSPSCVVISAKDTVDSIGTAINTAYTYTANRSGIGIEFETRSPNEPVKGGRVEHGGKYSIYKHLQTAVGCMTQVTRGGSATVTYTCLDPEVMDLLTMKQQRTSDAYRLDHLDYSMSVNNAFLERVAKNEDWYLISPYYAPELYDVFYSNDKVKFEEVYADVIRHKLDKTTKVKARDIAMRFITARGDTGRNYLFFVDNVNSHTPFKDKIRLSNLCQEISLPTKPYSNVYEMDKEQEGGETALCFLSAIVADDYTDDQYEELAYIVCKLIDNSIDSSVYPFKQVGFTARKRRSIGVGITNLAGYLAKNGWKYDTEDGRNAVHRLAERHSYFLHKASVRLARERGACEWVGKTKYSNGWLPIDTYTKEIDKHHSQDLQYDWEGLRKDVLKHGVRFSVLEAFMPCESSSVLSNSTNGLQPVRSLQTFKQSKKGLVFTQVPNIVEHGHNYQLAWDIDSIDLAKIYGIIQKFAGQGISADFYHDFSVNKSISASDMIKLMLFSSKIGIKTWYYLNFKVTSDAKTAESIGGISDEDNCESCKL